MGGSNNIHFDFPPIMSDGRNFASWQPESVINDEIRHKERIHTNWEYRQFLTNNATQIMKLNNKESCYDLGLNPHVQSGKKGSNNIPFTYHSTSDERQPSFGYSTSHLKNPYISREQLEARMIAPSITVPSSFSQKKVQ